MATAIGLSCHDIEGLCQRYLKEYQKAGEDECRMFHVLSFKVQPTSDAPAGFLGRHQFLSVCIQLQDVAGAQRLETLSFFTKSAPIEIASRMEYLEEFGVFKKEIFVYREVLPQLQQIFGGVTPRCYYAANGLLVFENLSQQGYRMGAGRDGLLDYAHLECAVGTLASMHAASIVYDVRQGKQLPQLHAAAVVENAYPSGVSQQNLRWQNFDNARTVLIEFIKQLPQYAHNVARITQEFSKQMEIIFELAKPSSRYQNVFSHGDLWANNVMFRYGDKCGKLPTACRFVDFQLARYAPAALDLITLLTIPTSRRFREQHLERLLCAYHRQLTELLKREGLSAADYLPLAQLHESVAEYRVCGLIESALFSHLTVLPPTLTQQLTSTADGFSDFFSRRRVEICMQAFHTDQTYRERLTDMLEDMIDTFVLQQCV